MIFLRDLVEARAVLWGICPACRRKQAAAQLDLALRMRRGIADQLAWNTRADVFRTIVCYTVFIRGTTRFRPFFTESKLNGGVKCRGRNQNGQLDNNSMTDSQVAVDVCADSACTAYLSGISRR